MPTKDFRVYFATTACGPQATPLAPTLRELFTEHGANLPAVELGDDNYQVRNLVRTGTVWVGEFAKLRDDAPHIVDLNDDEVEIGLEEGERVIDKCVFIYRERRDVLVWQVNRPAGGLSKFASYWSVLLDVLVSIPQVMNNAEIDRVLNGQLYELTFAYDRPDQLDDAAPAWNQKAFDLMENVHAAHAKFTMRAPRGGGLTNPAKTWIRRMLHGVNGFEKIRVRMTDDTDPIDLFMSPLKDSITVELINRYPSRAQVQQELEDAYERKRHALPAVAAP